MTLSSDRGGGIRVRRGVRVTASVLLLLLLAVLLFVPGFDVASILHRWFSVLLALLHGTILGPFLPASDTTLPRVMVLTVTYAAVLPRTARLAMRVRRFARRRKDATFARTATEAT